MSVRRPPRVPSFETMPAFEGLGLVLVMGALAAVLGVGLGIVLAPRIARALDRVDRDDEDGPSDEGAR